MLLKIINVLLTTVLINDVSGQSPNFHRSFGPSGPTWTIDEQELSPSYWNNQARKTIKQKLKNLNKNVAKNVIMFLGDGMSIPTFKETRVYSGQLQGNDGEASTLSFENFPYTGLSKTYCTDVQVPDSACTGTAYLCGIKNNMGTLGVTANVTMQDCEASLHAYNRVTSIGRWSQLKGKSTGIVTTTSVTDASPAALYANSAYRLWESDADGTPPACKDIATQLVYGETGRNLNVILGGGRRAFLPAGSVDEEGFPGSRLDGRNLVNDWLKTKNGKGRYVGNRTSLLNTGRSTDYLLGLFDWKNMKYHMENDESNPTLEEMTEAAIKVLSKNKNGYFLFVESGLIDYGHHYNRPRVAADETLELSKAVQKALDMTDEDETLIVITSDHSHTMTISGYPTRGNDIFGYSTLADDGKPYATLSYANGPGYTLEADGSRRDISNDDPSDNFYTAPSGAPLSIETHGGDDVAIFANGPWAHLFSGTMEQNVIPHAMAYASCVGYGDIACRR